MTIIEAMQWGQYDMTVETLVRGRNLTITVRDINDDVGAMHIIDDLKIYGCRVKSVKPAFATRNKPCVVIKAELPE